MTIDAARGAANRMKTRQRGADKMAPPNPRGDDRGGGLRTPSGADAGKPRSAKTGPTRPEEVRQEAILTRRTETDPTSQSREAVGRSGAPLELPISPCGSRRRGPK